MVRLTFIVGATGFAASATCRSVMHPTSGAKLDLSRAITVKWSSSSSDAANFNLFLLNQNRVPSVNLETASNLTVSDDSYTFDSVDALPGSGYVFDFKDGSGNMLAQSGEFTVVFQGSNTTSSSTTTNATSTDGTSTSTSNSTGIETPTGGVARNVAPPAVGSLVAVLFSFI